MAAKAKKRTAKKAPARKTAPKRAAPKRKVVKPIPDGYHSITPYICVDGAAEAVM